jgi:CMP-N,N'-diacetyllegionaminic acid synthase
VIAGKPLLAWTIESARRSKMLDRVIVSTEDEEIAEISRKWGARVPFIRPFELAQDDTATLPVMQHAVSWLESTEGYVPEIIVLLQPTSPLRRTEHIEQAVELLLQTGADSVVSVCLSEQSPYWMKRLEGDRVFPFLKEAPEYTRRQDLPRVYRLNGALYASRYDVLMRQKRILGEDTRAVVMDAESSIDIDSELDFKIAEMLLAERTDE